MNVVKLILNNLDGFKTRFTIVFIVGIFGGISSFCIGLTITQFTKSDFNLDRFYILVPTLLGVYFAYLFFAWVLRKYGESLAAQFENHIRFKYFKRLESLPAERITKLHSGYVLSLFNQIATGTNQIIFHSLWSLSASIAHVSMFFIFMARESFAIAIINFIILVCFVSLSTFLAYKMVEINKRLNIQRASLLESYADFITNIATIKKLAIYAFAEQKLENKTEENYKQIYDLQRLHAKRWLVLHTLYGTAFIGTIIYFLYEIAQGQQSVAMLILFVTAYGAVRYHMERLSETLKTLVETKAYADNVESILSGEEFSKLHRSVEQNDWKEIKISDIQMQYDENRKKISIPEFRISQKEKVCVEGVSGQGKTTLLQILINSYDPKNGTRSFGSMKYEDLPRSFFENKMVVISQEVELFNISLRENIVLGQKMKEEKIWKILDQMDLSSWIHSLEKGLDTVVGEKGVKLSAGQKQRINLVRALLLDRDIYLLDEPTSHLDAKTEILVVQFLEKYLENKTAVIVTHRPELRRICNRGYLFKNHTLQEQKG